MDENECRYASHVIVLPYHGQGHMNPMLQFSKRLAAKGIKITVAATSSTVRANHERESSLIEFESIYDDDREGGVSDPGGLRGFLDRFKVIGSRNLTRLITKFHDSDMPAKCLIYDANIPWASRVAIETGILRAAFFTQSCASIANYYLMHCDLLGVDKPSVPVLSMPELPELRIPKLPSLGPEMGCYPPILRFILSQFDNSEGAEWILFNSFDKLEEEVIKWLSTFWPMRTIGPTLPFVYLDNRVKDDNNYGLNNFTPNTDASLEWLDSKDKDSVIFVSFGTAASLSPEQIAEIAEALLNCGKSFLWAIKPSEQCKLPNNFVEKSSDKGLVVKWCPQLAVLAHEAVSCFVSHCGWNSTMEAISLGVAVVAMPQFLDQITNAHYVEHVWRVGIKPNTDDKGFASSDEIERCIKEVMEGDRGEEIKKNANRWRELAKEAIVEGGTLDKYIDELVGKLSKA